MPSNLQCPMDKSICVKQTISSLIDPLASVVVAVFVLPKPNIQFFTRSTISARHLDIWPFWPTFNATPCWYIFIDDWTPSKQMDWEWYVVWCVCGCLSTKQIRKMQTQGKDTQTG